MKSWYFATKLRKKHLTFAPRIKETSVLCHTNIIITNTHVVVMSTTNIIMNTIMSTIMSIIMSTADIASCGQ